MKKFLFNTLVIVTFVLVSVSVKAQPVITEYVVIKEPFKIDLSDKKIQKAVFNYKGLLDLEWNESRHTLAISYDPKLAIVKDIVTHIKDVVREAMPSEDIGTKK